MVISDDALLDALEASPFWAPEVRGRLAHLRVPGLRGRRTGLSHPFANLVGAATLDEATAGAAIAAVCALFAAGGQGFGWLVGLRSTPADLAVRSTSAPICARLGFVELGGFELLEWRPESSSIPAHGGGARSTPAHVGTSSDS